MTSIIKNHLKSTFVYDIVKYVRGRKKEQEIRAQQEREIREWEAGGKPVPAPHIVKQRIVRDYARRFSLQTMIETGTYLGDMVEAMKDTFTRIFSIELDGELYERAKKRFHSNDHISILRGDSGKVLPNVLTGIKRPCLFWLDGHYSGGITAKAEINTPIIEELNHIFDHPVGGHVILIDDARCFVGQDNYPAIDELREIIFKWRPDWIFEVEHDIVRIHQRRHKS